MAFDKSHMAAMVHADGQTWWQYKSSDSKSDIDTTGYFNEAAAMLKVNDLVWIIASDGAGFSYVNTHSGTEVDIANVTVIGRTDSD